MKFRPTEFLNTPYRVSCYIKLYRKLFSVMRPIRYFQVVMVLPPGVKWQMPLCGVYPLVSKKTDVLDFTIGMIKKGIHFNGKSPSFCNMM